MILVIFVEPFHDTSNAHSIKLFLEGLVIVIPAVDLIEGIDESIAVTQLASVAIANELATPQWQKELRQVGTRLQICIKEGEGLLGRSVLEEVERVSPWRGA